MLEASATAYDSVIYPGYAYAQTHPDHLAALAQLCGLSPAPLDTCRVLEIGCGDGANLIPMAVALPRARFRGFDLAASSIERGRDLARELALANLTLDHLDICDAPDSMGEFDYIICHGFYSWVPQPARDKLMAICKASLAPQGIAFVSYNTLPGGHVRRMVREMMLFHVERSPDAESKIKQARALVGFLSQLSKGDDEYQLMLKKEFERVYKYPPGYLYHDDLAPISDAFYLHEFVDHASKYDLQYLGDLNTSFVHVGNLEENTARALEDLEATPLLREQYLDFAYCRRFRQTLLCHQGLPSTHRLDPQRLEGLLVSSAATRTSENPDLKSDAEEEFHGARNASLKTSHPVTKATLIALRAAWPQRLALAELRERVAELLDAPCDSVSPDLLSRAALSAFSMRILDLHAYSPRIANRAGDRPKTTALIRLQAQREMILTNLLHQSVKVEGDALRILAMLDGTRNREQLAREQGTGIAKLDEVLTHFARTALLEE